MMPPARRTADRCRRWCRPDAVRRKPLGLIGVCRCDRLRQLGQAQTGPRRECRRVRLHPHRRLLTTADRHEPDARQLRNLRREPRVGKRFDLAQWKHIRRERQCQDRGIRGIDLAVDRRIREIGREQGPAGVDGGLHLLLGDVDVQREIELQRDDRAPERARRGHLLQPGHLSELPLERRRNRGGGHVRARAGVKRRDLNRRIVDLGQSRYRQLLVGNAARDDHGDHQQRRRDGSEDERT